MSARGIRKINPQMILHALCERRGEFYGSSTMIKLIKELVTILIKYDIGLQYDISIHNFQN
jgi:hypothetical protein